MISQISKLHQTNGKLVAQVVKLSTAAQPSNNVKELAKKRSKHSDELTSLRKVWQKEFAEKKQVEADVKRAEREKIVLQRAIKLREQRKELKQKQEQVEKERQEAFLRYKENLYKTQLYWKEKQTLQVLRREFAAKLHEQEVSSYITESNIHEKITPELFEKESTTTGLMTPTSNLWKYQTFAPTLKRLFNDQYFHAKLAEIEPSNTESANSFLQNRLKSKSDFRVTKRLMVEDFLNEMIGSGDERSQFTELVKDVSEHFEKLDGFQDLKEFYSNPYQLEQMVEESRVEFDESAIKPVA